MIYKIVPFEELFYIPSRNGLTKPKVVRGSGIKFINMGELFAHDRIFDIETDRVPVTKNERLNFLLQENDLLFARQSLVLSGVGKCSIVKKIKQETTYDSHLIRVRIDKTKASPDFYYYFFKSPQGKWHIQSIASQVAAAGIRGSDLRNMEVPYPPLPLSPSSVVSPPFSHPSTTRSRTTARPAKSWRRMRRRYSNVGL